MEEQNVELSEALASVEELLTVTEASTIFIDKNGSFCFMTKSGRKQYLLDYIILCSLIKSHPQRYVPQ